MKTERFEIENSGATLVVLENGHVRVFPLESQHEWMVGRYTAGSGETPDIIFHSKIVSRVHGWFRKSGENWWYSDSSKNLNGTFHNGTKMPRKASGLSSRVMLEHGDILRIDNDDPDHVHDQGVLMLFCSMPLSGTWTTYALTGKPVLIGRDSSCDIIEPLPYVSARHALIDYSGGKYILSDCGSRAGTFLNGRAVTGKILLRDKDCIFLCGRTYFFLGDKLLYAKQSHGMHKAFSGGKKPVILSANIQSKKVNTGWLVRKEKELLHSIRIDIREGTLVAVLGTAGAGKSTLMGCLSGLDQSGVTGNVIYRGVDLVKNLDQIKYLIGNVPQEKVIRPELTPEQAFTESAELRLSAEITQDEIKERVRSTLELLSMTKVKDNLNSRLSGGEQTRVNLGIEMVADRDIYFLDEPEQGLSPNLRDDLYVFLRTLAHDHGKTIIAIIHDVSCIDMFDQVIFLVKSNNVGRLAFSGSPAEGSKRFGVPIGKAYALLEENPDKYVIE